MCKRLAYITVWEQDSNVYKSPEGGRYRVHHVIQSTISIIPQSPLATDGEAAFATARRTCGGFST